MNLGLSYTDWRRIFWTFIQAALGFALAAAAGWVGGDAWTWKTLLVGALAAGFSAVKNFVLADDSALK